MTNASKQTKSERQAAARAAQLEAHRKREAAAKRSRIAIIALSILGVLAVIAVVAVVIVANIAPGKPAPAGVQTWSGLAQTHTEDAVTYQMDPPAGGPHNPAWLNCGVYTEPQQNENAVHSLEHGAIWVTYDPAVSEQDLAAMRDRLPATYALLSPYPGLDTPFAVSAWGAQLKFSDPADPAFDDFVQRYWRASDAPEPTAPCDGAIDGPGKQ